ncbi:MAG: Uma2 family endonuclease [Thermomicrobiales bacterium]
MTITTRLVTVAEFEALPNPLDGTRLELDNGEVITVKGAGAEHGVIMTQLAYRLRTHVIERSLGLVFGDGTNFVLSAESPTVRVPDVAFISRDHIPAGRLPKGSWPIPPDLAVEITSPNDREAEMRAKIGQYLAAGTRLVWTVSPEDETVTVHRPGSPPVQLGRHGTLDGGDVLPGFSVQVSALFEIEM